MSKTTSNATNIWFFVLVILAFCFLAMAAMGAYYLIRTTSDTDELQPQYQANQFSQPTTSTGGCNCGK